MLRIINTVPYPNRSRMPQRLRDSRLGCVASEGGAPFVARRAMNLHGWRCTGLTVPPVLPTAGVPQGMYLVREWGVPPPAATPPDPPVVPPFFLLRGYPRERISYGSGAGAFRAVFPIRCRTNEMVY